MKLFYSAKNIFILLNYNLRVLTVLGYDTCIQTKIRHQELRTNIISSGFKSDIYNLLSANLIFKFNKGFRQVEHLLRFQVVQKSDALIFFLDVHIKQGLYTYHNFYRPRNFERISENNSFTSTAQV